MQTDEKDSSRGTTPTLGVGIIGFGAIGQVHAWAHENLKWYYDLPVKTEIRHIVTSREETARMAAERTGARTGTDPDALCTSDDIDLVHICTPNSEHAGALRLALDNGKFVYSDKPLTGNLTQAVALERQYGEELRNRVGMTFQWRFLPATMHAAELVHSGKLGRILSFRATYLHSGNANPETPISWKLAKGSGGGVIADLASHLIDLLAYLGADYRRVIPETSTAFSSRPAPDGSMHPVDAEDSVIALIRATFPGSDETALGSLEASKIATGTEDELAFELHGTEGALRFHSTAADYLQYYRSDGDLSGRQVLATGRRYPEPARRFPSPKAHIGWLRAHAACLAESVSAFAAGRPPQPNGTDALTVERVMQEMRSDR